MTSDSRALSPEVTPAASPREAAFRSVYWVNFRWLRALRWAAVVGQTLTVAVVALALDVPIRTVPILVVIGLELGVNLAALARERSSLELSEGELASWVGVDLIAFTALLFLTGGPRNPFSFFYVVHVAMAALTLAPVFAWSLVALSVWGYGALFAWNVPLPTSVHPNLLLHGSWTAYALGASCIVYFVDRARSALRRREELLMEQRDLRLQAERLSSLGTLAAGAAHELANPLATIAVVSKELEHELRRSGQNSALDDVLLVRGQVERCRKILTRMAHTAGEAPGEADTWTSLPVLLEEALSELPTTQRIELELSPSARRLELRCPREALAQTLRVLVDNGLEASAPASVVRLKATFADETLTIAVSDLGPGMTADVLQRAFEPFFTTKPTGRGMGLGLFLARNVALRLGGGLQLHSATGQGTVAELTLPSYRTRIAATTEEPYDRSERTL